MRYFSMFSGIGGFELGIQNAFDPTRILQRIDHGYSPTPDSTRSLRTEPLCIGYSEIDKYAIKTYEEHFNHENYGDATKINAKALPDFDLVVGGFPCQSFSVAGKRKGFDDTRGTLFFDIARILAEKRPRHLVLENVKGLLSHDGGQTFTTILGVLADLGYTVEWQVLNSKNFGVPQNRERVYIIGHLGGVCGRQVFPLKGNNRTNTELERPQTANTLTANYFKGPAANRPLVGEGSSEHDTDEQLGRTQTATRQPLRFLNRNQKNIEGDYAYTVDSSQTSGVKVSQRIRKLTPIECERLQGFPDNWTLGSDTQRYKQCGNAVTTNVVEAVISALRPCLK